MFCYLYVNSFIGTDLIPSSSLLRDQKLTKRRGRSREEGGSEENKEGGKVGRKRVRERGEQRNGSRRWVSRRSEGVDGCRMNLRLT